MATHKQFEVEIKCLLGEKAKADALLAKIKVDPTFALHGKNKQLNHYFDGGDPRKILKNLLSRLSKDQITQFQYVIDHGKNYSVRTRQADDKIIFVLKGAADETTSANGTARHEFEALLSDFSLDELDKIILDSGYRYQAKWSREREEYNYKNMIITIDKNAGYGYLAEVERVVGDESELERVKSEIREELVGLGLEELPQDRLARMFDYYNSHWQDYYGTDKTFVII